MYVLSYLHVYKYMYVALVHHVTSTRTSIHVYLSCAHSPRTTRSLSTPGDYLPPPLPSPSSSPHRSPRHSPHTKRRATDFANITTSELEAVTRGEVKGVEPDTPPSGIDRERTSSSTKSRWRRHAVIRRKNSGGRSNSVGSDFSETQSESPTEKMVCVCVYVCVCV